MSLPYCPQQFTSGTPLSSSRGLTFPVMKTAEFSTTYTEAPNRYATTVQNSINPFWHWTLIYNYISNRANRTLPIYSPWTDYQIIQGFYLQVGAKAQPFLMTDPGTALGSPDNSVGPALLTGTTALPYPAWQANRLYIQDAVIVDSANHAQQITTVVGPTGWTTPSFNHGGGTASDNGNTWQDLGLVSSAYPSGVPNPNAQLQLVTDGTFWYSPLQRNFGGQFLEDITDLNTIPTLGGSSLAVYSNGVLQTGGGVDYTLLGPGLATPTASFLGMYLKWNSVAFSPADVPSQPITASFNFFFRVRFEMDELDFEQFLQDVFTIGGPDSKNGAGYLKLMTARPTPL